MKGEKFKQSNKQKMYVVMMLFQAVLLDIPALTAPRRVGIRVMERTANHIVPVVLTSSVVPHMAV
jgi:hypothetical protein